MSARRPMTLPAPPLRPRMTPTTPVRPMPVTTSSQPKALSFSATAPAVRCTSYSSSGMGMQVAPPGGDFGVQIGDAIDDRHELAPCSYQCSKPRGARASSTNKGNRPIDRAGRHPYTGPFHGDGRVAQW